jgi:hypothetical protein
VPDVEPDRVLDDARDLLFESRQRILGSHLLLMLDAVSPLELRHVPEHRKASL